MAWRAACRSASLLDVVAQRLDDRVERLVNAAATELERRAGRLDALARGLRHPREPLKEREARIIAAGRALRAGMRARLAAALDRHGGAPTARRAGAPPRARHDVRPGGAPPGARGAGPPPRRLFLSKGARRGFVLVRDEAGAALVSVAATAPDMAVCLRFADGEAGASITDGAPRPAPRPAKPPRKKSPPGPIPARASCCDRAGGRSPLGPALARRPAARSRGGASHARRRAHAHRLRHPGRLDDRPARAGQPRPLRRQHRPGVARRSLPDRLRARGAGVRLPRYPLPRRRRRAAPHRGGGARLRSPEDRRPGLEHGDPRRRGAGAHPRGKPVDRRGPGDQFRRACVRFRVCLAADRHRDRHLWGPAHP